MLNRQKWWTKTVAKEALRKTVLLHYIEVVPDVNS